MTIHVNFVEHQKAKRRLGYDFSDNHTGDPIAVGEYNNGDFDLLCLRSGGSKKFPSAAVAWVYLNRNLIDEYGY